MKKYVSLVALIGGMALPSSSNGYLQNLSNAGFESVSGDFDSSWNVRRELESYRGRTFEQYERTHFVLSGENLIDISERYCGDKRRFRNLADFNKLKNSDRVVRGQVLNVSKLACNF